MNIPKQLRNMLTVFFATLLFFLFFSLWGFYLSIRPLKFVSTTTPSDLGLAYEDVSFSTKDGVTLRGWFIPNAKSEDAETIILLHGYPADKGNILPALAFLSESYHLLLFDFRYLGESDGWYSTAGVKEVQDLLAAIQFLKSRGIEEVGVWGFSLGGAVALMTAQEAPEIQAIVSESSYARLDLLASQLYPLPILKYPLGELTMLWARVLLGVDPKSAAPATSAKTLDIPVLLIHSTNDKVIPFEHAQFIEKALKNNPKAEFWFQENLLHGQFSDEYQERVWDFFDRNLMRPY